MKKIAKNQFGEYESNDLWFRRLPIISHYYFGKIKKILCSWIEIKEGTVLDFGCGQQRLKDFLPKGLKYIGYDLIPDYTDVGDYRKTDPDLFFSVSSFEHVTHEELDDILKWIISSNIKQVFVDLPIRNDRYILWTLMGFRKKVTQEHHLDTIPYDLQDMHNRIAKYLKLKREVRYHNHALTEWCKEQLMQNGSDEIYIEKEYSQDKMKTPVHLCIGQEVIAAGVCAKKHKDDIIKSVKEMVKR